MFNLIRAIGYILENEKEDLILERVHPQLQSNIFHYACFHCNYPVNIKLLYNYNILICYNYFFIVF